MEHVRRTRLLAPLAAIVVVGAVGLIRPAALRAADPPWDPPPCPAAGPQVERTATWYALDPQLDGAGWLTGRRLTLGRADGGAPRHMDLGAESFAAGPVGGCLVVGDDDGTSSRLRLVDVAAGCAAEVGRERSVVRSAILEPGGAALLEHRVSRSTRADEGIWRRPLDGGAPRRVLRGLPFDAAFGPTFSTELSLTADGRLAVASCGELACRLRVLDPASGRVDRVDGIGPLLGIVDDLAVAYVPCGGFPCRVEGVDLRTGRRSTIVEAAGPAAIGGRTLVHETVHRDLELIDLETTGRTPVASSVAGLPVRGGSHATSGADLPVGWVLIAPDGHIGNPAAARRLDATGGDVEALVEVRP